MTANRSLKYTLLVLLIVLTATGCNQQAPEQKAASPTAETSGATTATDAVQNLVRRYNKLLIDGYQTNNMTNLQQVATQELAQKAYYHMAAIGEGKSRMVSQLKKIDFLKTDFGTPGKCRIVTRELWDFGYADIATGKISNQVKDYLYDVQYLLEIRQGHWMITEITASGEERKEVPSWGKMFGNK